MNILITGRRRQGKSTLAFYLAQHLSKGVIIFDPNRQFRIDKAFYTSNVDDLEDHLSRMEDGEKISPVIIFRPSGHNVENDFEEMAQVLWEHGNYTLIIDEAHQLQNSRAANPWLLKFIREAPTDQDAPDTIHIIQTTHRPQDLNSVVRSQSNEQYHFRAKLPRDLDVVEEECGEEARTRIALLPRHHVLKYNVDEETIEVWDDPSVWHITLRPERKAA